jgi:hypothetical protein
MVLVHQPGRAAFKTLCPEESDRQGILCRSDIDPSRCIPSLPMIIGARLRR